MITEEQLDKWEKGGIVVLHKSDEDAFRTLDERCMQLITEVRRLRERDEGWEMMHDKQHNEIQQLRDLLKRADKILEKTRYPYIGTNTFRPIHPMVEIKQLRSEIAEALE